MDIGALKLKVNVDSKGLDDLKQSASDIKKAFESIDTEALAEGLEKIAGGMAGFITDVGDMGDAIDKNSRKLGFSNEAYQEWESILGHAGSDIGGLNEILKSMDKQIESGSEAFTELGVNLEDLALGTHEQKFETLVAALQNVEDETQKAKLAQQVFGEQYAQLLPLLQESNEDIIAQKDALHEMGAVMSDEDVAAAAAYKDATQDVQSALNALKTNIVSAFLPTINRLANTAKDVVGVFNSLPGPIQDVVSVIAGLAAGAGACIAIVGKFGPMIKNGITLIQNIIPVIKALWALIAAHPFVAIAAAIAALVVLVVKNWDKVKEILSNIWKTVKDIFNKIISFLGESISKMWKSITSFLTNVVKNVVDFIGSIPKKLLDLGGKFFEAGKAILNKLWDGLKSIATTVVDWAKKFGGTIIDALTGDIFDLNGSKTNKVEVVHQVNSQNAAAANAAASQNNTTNNRNTTINNTYNIPQNSRPMDTALAIQEQNRKEQYGYGN